MLKGDTESLAWIFGHEQNFSRKRKERQPAGGKNLEKKVEFLVISADHVLFVCLFGWLFCSVFLIVVVVIVVVVVVCVCVCVAEMDVPETEGVFFQALILSDLSECDRLLLLFS